MHQFRNDYSEGAHPLIMEALARTNLEQCVGYGGRRALRPRSRAHPSGDRSTKRPGKLRPRGHVGEHPRYHRAHRGIRRAALCRGRHTRPSMKRARSRHMGVASLLRATHLAALTCEGYGAAVEHRCGQRRGDHPPPACCTFRRRASSATCTDAPNLTHSATGPARASSRSTLTAHAWRAAAWRQAATSRSSTSPSAPTPSLLAARRTACSSAKRSC